MQTETLPISAAPNTLQQAELYLHSVNELSRQLEEAMLAVVAQSLPAFQDSVCRQRETCSQLLALPRYLDPDSAYKVSDSDLSVDADLTARIAAAGVTLQTLNTRYSALLGHTGDTIRLMARFLGGYSTSASARSAAGTTNLSTWSCEV